VIIFHNICCFSIFSSNFIVSGSGVTIQFRIRRHGHATSTKGKEEKGRDWGNELSAKKKISGAATGEK